MRMSARTWVVALGTYVVAAVVVTYPLVRELGAALPGVQGDGGLYLWCADTFWLRIRHGQTPFFTDRIFVPMGANLAYSACVPFLSFLALPFLSHLIFYGGLLSLVSLVAAAVGMMLLVHELTRDEGAAAVAGLLYGFSPPLLSLLAVSQFHEVVAAALVPFGIVNLLRFMRTGAWWPLLLLSAIAWAIYFTFVYSFVMFLVMCAIVGAALLGRVGAGHVRRGAVVVAGNLLLAWIFMGWVLPPTDWSDVPHGGYSFTSRANVNLADTLVPSAHNPLFGAVTAKWASDRPNNDIDSYFLGWGILLLAVAAVLRRRWQREIVGIAVAAVVILLLSCGSAIRFGRLELATHDWTPFDWLARLPRMELLDAPRRFVPGVSVAVTALAGVALAMLTAWSGRSRAVLAGGVLLFALEYGQIGTQVTRIPVPAIYRQLADASDGRTVLELGAGLAASNSAFGLDWGTPSSYYAYWQTIHGKPRVGGYVSRISHSEEMWFRQAPIISDIFTMVHAGTGKWSGKSYSPEDVDAFLRTFNLGYVVVPPTARQQEFAEVMEQLLAGRIVSTARADKYILYTLADRDGEQYRSAAD